MDGEKNQKVGSNKSFLRSLGMKKLDVETLGLGEIPCPSGFTLANLKAELVAVWESSVKEWKIELAYPQASSDSPLNH